MIQKHRDHAHDEKDQDRKLVMIADEIDKVCLWLFRGG